MSNVIALASDATALNLSLTGIQVEEFANAREAEPRCDELLSTRIEVLILDEAFRGAFSDRLLRRLKVHKGEPLVVYCPAFEEEDSEVDAYLSSIIKPAVGFEIRLD